MNIVDARFIKSAASPADFIRDGLPCVVFAGRSNVGKSSVINMLTRRKSLARVGSAPGKTTHVNYFSINSRFYLADLPGYGYAKVSKSEKERWGRLMEEFFSDQSIISCGVMVVDSRHKPTLDDITMAKWFQASECPFIVAANKCDKLKKSELVPNMERVRETLSLSESMPVLPVSAQSGAGREELLEKLAAALVLD